MRNVTKQGQKGSFFVLFFLLVFFVFNSIAFAAEKTDSAELTISQSQAKTLLERLEDKG